MKQATTEPIAMDARYRSGLPIVGTTKIPPCGARSVHSKNMDNAPAVPATDDASWQYANWISCCKWDSTFCDEGKAHNIVCNTRFAFCFCEAARKECSTKSDCQRRNHTACHYSRHDTIFTSKQVRQCR